MSGFKQSENSFGRVPNSSTPSKSFTTVATHRMPEKVMSDLINVAVYLIAVFAKVELFLYCLVSFPFRDTYLNLVESQN
jgi:hypothetical protein